MKKVKRSLKPKPWGTNKEVKAAMAKRLNELGLEITDVVNFSSHAKEMVKE